MNHVVRVHEGKQTVSLTSDTANLFLINNHVVVFFFSSAWSHLIVALYEDVRQNISMCWNHWYCLYPCDIFTTALLLFRFIYSPFCCPACICISPASRSRHRKTRGVRSNGCFLGTEWTTPFSISASGEKIQIQNKNNKNGFVLKHKPQFSGFKGFLSQPKRLLDLSLWVRDSEILFFFKWI